jgi:formamidopyrimidine-DNA glycosylase
MSPLNPAFTFEHFQSLLAEPEEREKKSVKYFMISKPGLGGVGNGCLHDILFQAKLDPRRRIAALSDAEQRALYDATLHTLTQMIDQGGRSSERDLYNRPGGYEGILSSETVGTLCPRCGTPIAKVVYLGGASYFCPGCQR